MGTPPLAPTFPALAEQGLEASRALHRAILRGGTPARRVADALHGTWLGHPLHPVLTDVTVGSWSAGAFFDALALGTGSRFARKAGHALAAFGTASAVPTVLAGLADFSAVPKRAAETVTLHAAANDAAITLYVLSLVQRRRGRHRAGAWLALAGFATSGLGAYLGGHLVYRHRVGADHSQDFRGWDGWKDALAAGDLPEGALKRVEVEGKAVLLHRDGGALYAIDAVCAHAGGPLEEGEVRDCTVRCPWHDSVFSLRDGRVVHGPSVHPQQAFEARERAGRIELRPANQE